MDAAQYTGSCLCGGVRYAVTGTIEKVSHCHCSMCRKAHGAAFATYGSVRQQQHAFLAGAALLRSYRSSEAVLRMFCSTCGAPLLWRRENGRFAGWVSFPLGSLDTPYVAPAHRHIHVASKVPWFAITDGWPQADTS